MGRAKSKTRKGKARARPRPPRLRPDRRRKADPSVFVGVSPQDVPPFTKPADIPPEARPTWNPRFDDEVFTRVDHDSTGKPLPGRPRVPIDLEDVRRIGLLGCTDNELAAFFGVNVRTIERRKLLDPEFRRALDEGRAEAKLSIRRTQIVVATETKDWRALEWLGRNWLGQRKEPHVEAPPLASGKSPLLETLERMEKAMAAASAPPVPTSDEQPSDDAVHESETPSDEPEDAPHWRRG